MGGKNTLTASLSPSRLIDRSHEDIQQLQSWLWKLLLKGYNNWFVKEKKSKCDPKYAGMITLDYNGENTPEI